MGPNKQLLWIQNQQLSVGTPRVDLIATILHPATGPVWPVIPRAPRHTSHCPQNTHREKQSRRRWGKEQQTYLCESWQEYENNARKPTGSGYLWLNPFSQCWDPHPTQIQRLSGRIQHQGWPGSCVTSPNKSHLRKCLTYQSKHKQRKPDNGDESEKRWFWPASGHVLKT